MKWTVSNDFMVKSLSSLLEDGEILRAPFYGTIVKIGHQRNNWFSLIGLTNSAMLVANLNGIDASRIEWTTRVPLDIKKVKIKASIIPNQVLISIEFNEGNDMRIRAAKRVLLGDLKNQETNLTDFINVMSRYQ